MKTTRIILLLILVLVLDGLLIHTIFGIGMKTSVGIVSFFIVNLLSFGLGMRVERKKHEFNFPLGEIPSMEQNLQMCEKHGMREFVSCEIEGDDEDSSICCECLDEIRCKNCGSVQQVVNNVLHCEECEKKSEIKHNKYAYVCYCEECRTGKTFDKERFQKSSPL